MVEAVGREASYGLVHESWGVVCNLRVFSSVLHFDCRVGVRGGGLSVGRLGSHRDGRGKCSCIFW